MRMNALLPLGIDYADPMRAIATGALARERVDANQTRNALAAAYAQHGAGAMRGDTNALAGIAALDPAAAQGLYTGVQENRRADETMALRRDAAELSRMDTQSAISARSASVANDSRRLQLAEQQAAQAMAQADRETKLQTITMFSQFLPELETAQTEEDWNRITTAMGVDDTPFSERATALAMARGALRGAQGEATTGFKTLDERARAAQLVPGSPEYSDFMLNGGVQRTQAIPTFRPATAQEAQQYGSPAGQIDEATGRFYPAESKDTTTEGERKAAGYLGRMEAAGQAIDEAPADGQRINHVQDWLSWVGVPDAWIFSGDEATVQQKQMDWVRAKLRYESGAVIGDDEARQEAATYFPRPGDRPERVKAKEESRKQAIEQMRLAAGRAAPGGVGAPVTGGQDAPPPAAVTPPPELLNQLQGQPAGTRVQGPDGSVYVWDGRGLTPAR